jgi:hypothetical protein
MRAQKTYTGDRTIDGITVMVDGAPLPECTDVRALSTDGFEWGYEGPPCAQLALALLVDHLGDPVRAVALHDAFMRAIVANFANEWVMTSADVAAAVDALAAEAEAR